MVSWEGNRLTVGDDQFLAMWNDVGAWLKLRRRRNDPSWIDPVDPDLLYICKTARMVADLVDHVQTHRPQRILELGIFCGGSTALLAALEPEATIVAIDIDESPVADLERYLERTGSAKRVHLHYGVDQQDRERLREIMTAAFGDQPIDLVIDDASHELGPSRASLDIVVPFVAPGGCYSIEDWEWGLADLSEMDDTLRDLYPRGPGLHALVAEIALAVGSKTRVFDGLELNRTWAKAWRGPAELDPETFTLAGYYTATESIEVRSRSCQTD